jgi:hypothetical protein
MSSHDFLSSKRWACRLNSVTDKPQVFMGASALDLELTVAVGEAERLECTLMYNTDVYDAATAKRMLAHLMACPAPCSGCKR